MASDRLKLPPPTSKRTPSPAISVTSPYPADRRKDGREILERLQATSRSSPNLLMAASRTATPQHVSLSKRSENVKTIRERVRSTDNPTGKGLLAADLIKNLQSQQKSSASAQFLRAVSAGVHCHPKMTQAQRPHSENSARLLTPDFSNFGRRLSLPAPSVKQKSRVAKDILKKYSVGMKSEESTLTENNYEQGSLPSLRKVSSANTVITIYQAPENDDESDNITRQSMSDAKKNQRRASLNAPSESRQRPLTSENKRQRPGDKGWIVGGSMAKSHSRKNIEEENAKVQDLTEVVQPLHYAKSKDGNSVKSDHPNISNNEKVNNLRTRNALIETNKDNEDEMSGSDSDAEDSVEDVRPLKKKRAPTHKRNAPKEGLSSEQDSSDEEDKCKKVHNRVRQRKSGIGTVSEANVTDEEEESDVSSNESGSDSENEDRQGRTTRKDKVANAGGKSINEEDSDSESDEEAKENDNLIVDEELEELSKKLATPGMPAMDLLETRDKLVVDGLITERKETLKNKKKKKDDNEEDADDLDDLIDDIDDLIDADDEDIAYNSKMSKKKDFIRGARLVMSLNKAVRKDES